MEVNLQKEQFSYAYLYAVASTAGYGFQLALRALDFDGIDAVIAGRGGNGAIRYPRLELQIKSTAQDLIDNDVIKYPLPIKNYNDLRIANCQAPRILVVVLIPENPGKWLQQSEQELCLSHGAYWLSLQGYPASQNQKSVTLAIPRQNIFNVEALQQLMQQIEAGKFPCL